MSLDPTRPPGEGRASHDATQTVRKSVGASAFQQLVGLCGEFESGLLGGEGASIEAMLDRVEPGLRPKLLEMLLPMELDHRIGKGQTPIPDDYLRRFPEAIEVVASAFSSHASPLGETQPGSGPRPDRGPHQAAPAIAGYELLGELGRGGMGVVYKARHRQLQRLCALKMVLAGPHAGPEALVRFLAEAEAVARLRHPHIVTIHHIGEHDGLPFIELEYLEGGSLAARLDGTPLPPRGASELVATLAGAVQAAHEAGIVHRDLKPANVLLDGDGTAKVADFGVAKALGSDTELTATDSILGSPSYMAPEQAEGRSKDVGPTSDVYALGAILYECLTGRPPFRGATVLETLEQVKKTEPVPPSRLVPGLPRDVETIALKCLQKEPAKRYGSANDLTADLRRFLDRSPIVARPVPTWERLVKWGRRRPAIATLVVLVPLLLTALIGLGAWSNVRIRNSLEEQRRQNAVNRVKLAMSEYQAANIAVAEEHLNACPEDLRDFEWYLVKRLCHRERSTYDDHESIVWDIAFSPSSDRILSVAGGWLTGRPGLGEVLVRDARTGRIVFERRGLRHGQFAATFDPASGGRLLAVGGGIWGNPVDATGPGVVEGSLDVWDTVTGERRIIDEVDGQNVIDVAYSPDGTVLAAAYGRYINEEHQGYAQLWDMATGGPIGERFPGLGSGVSALAFSPDGCWLALAKGDTGDGHCEVEVWEWRTRDLLWTSSDAKLFVKDLKFDPTGQLLAAAETRSRLIRLWDARTGAEVGTFQGHEGFIEDLAFSPDGQVLASSGQDHLVKLWNVADGDEIETLRGHSSFVLSVAFDSEGRRLATGDFAGTLKVWEVEPGQPARLKTDGWPIDLAFLPDGRRLVTAPFAYTKEFAPQLWDLSTGRLLQSFRGHEGVVGSVAISRSGSLMVSGSWRPPDQTARVWDVETGRQLALLDHQRWGGVRDVAFHPKDDTVLATACSDGTVRLWTIDPTGEAPPMPEVVGRVNVIVRALAFRPSMGQELVAGTEDGSVHVWNIETGAEVIPLLTDLGATIDDVAFSRDGTLLAIAANPTEMGETGWSGSVFVYEMEAGQEHFTLTHSNSVKCVAFSPGGTRLATASEDKTVKLWNLDTGQDVLTLRNHTAGAISVAFSPDGHRLASGSYDLKARVWDATPVE